MANEEIILQIFFVTVGILIFSILLNRILGLRPEKMKAFREKVLNLQERVKNAEILGDQGLMAQLQLEMMGLLKQMMKKQFVPMLARCAIFLGILFLLGIIYADYSVGLLPFPILIFGSGWFALYFLFSLGLSLALYGVKRAYKKATGKENKSKSFTREMMGLMAPYQKNLSGPFQLPPRAVSKPVTSIQSPQPQLIGEKPAQDTKTSSAWKDKMKK